VNEFLLDLARPGRSLAGAMLQERGCHVHDIGSVPGIGQRSEECSGGVGAVQGDQDGQALISPPGGECASRTGAYGTGEMRPTERQEA
jgi:hypothetical protein